MTHFFSTFCTSILHSYTYKKFSFIAGPTIDILLSPKDTRIKEHDGVFLVCEFRSSTKIKVLWEKHGDLLPDGQVSTTQWKYTNYFVVIFSLTIIFFFNAYPMLYL